MADISDVMAVLAKEAANACYPPDGVVSNGSVTGGCIVIREGWPVQRDLLNLMSEDGTWVSVHQVPGASANTYQIIDDPHVIIPAEHGVTATIDGNSVTFSGVPTALEYISVIVNDKKTYSRLASDTPGTLNNILVQLIADINVDHPTAILSGTTITFPIGTFVLARSGAPAKMGQVTTRQRHSIMITVWANSPQSRTKVAEAIDVWMKSKLTFEMPDTSMALIRYEGTHILEENLALTLFRRDLIYDAEYATIDVFYAHEVTSFNPTVTSDNGAVFQGSY